MSFLPYQKRRSNPDSASEEEKGRKNAPDRGTACVFCLLSFVPWQTEYGPAYLPQTADGHADGSPDSDTEDVFHIFPVLPCLRQFYSTLPVPAVPAEKTLVRSVGICRWNVSGGNGERYGTVVLCPP